MQAFQSKEDVSKALKRAQSNYLRRMRKYDWFQESERPFRTELRHRKRTGDFAGANVSFDPVAMTATSYRWWYFVKRIGGLVVFNDYRYSVSTSRHQSKVRGLMRSLGIKIDLTIEAPKGLQDLGSALSLYEDRIKGLLAAIANPRSRKDKNAERAASVRDLQARVKTIKKLMAKEAF